jgi:hypothetical protein
MLKSPRQIRKKVLRPSRPGEKRARGQADGVGDQIGRHHPRGFVIADPHAAGDVGQDHVGDRGVEHLHEGRERDQDGDQPRAGQRCALGRRSAGLGGRVAHTCLRHCSTRAFSRS